ncbi:U32 family peptidase [Methanosphaera sp. WGK6]|uniref:U32 family peptidase n=1 Tax=Methanosphaera sp. WGK6 TaxID=1561964 RepID=UPI00084C4E9D|nr:U32 family peptidase [Methanosphaera sp. WGK6]OED30092.1 hypothetical protein NL43_05110 [Methanosphaera sp. WGK6]
MANDDCKILAPVGSEDVLPAAVFSGADYVYLSGNKYGARDFADNFNYDGLKNAINFCHKFNVKVFVTVNISILESELIDVLDYVFYLYSHGADAVIIQDIGLASIVRELIPDLELHASTQMTIYDYSFVKWLSENGFSNVNISREVPLTRIKTIVSKLHEFNHDINIEVFGHGALCYCYSGQCLMSSFLGGRSGNRGLCAQPCRMRYILEDSYNVPLTDSTYLLSTKDLCTYNNVKDFIDAGIDSIKIEGRMKAKEYVSSSTYCYKQAVEGNYNADDFLLLNLAFNRGLTSGYINENSSDDVVGRERSGSQGYPIGRVIKVEENKITIKFGNRRFPTKIVNGDGLKFEYENESCGMYVSKIISQTKNKITLLNKKNIPVEEDSMVYITYSKYLQDKTKSIINQKHLHKIGLNLNISINNNSQMVIKCTSDNLKKPVTYTSKEVFEEAKNKPLTKDTVNKQLRKTGNTTFKINKIDYENFQDNLFMPMSSLNNIRRSLLEIIAKNIRKSYIPPKGKIQKIQDNIESFKKEHYHNKNNIDSDKTWNIYINKIQQAEIITKYDYIDTVYYDGSYNYDSIKDYCQNIYDELREVKKIIGDKKLVWILPQLLLDNEIGHVSEILLKFNYEDIDIKVQTDNIGVANELDTNCYGNNLNIYNNYSIKTLSENPGFERLTISNELSYNDIKKLKNYCSLEYIVFGNVQLMLSEDDFENLLDSYRTDYYYLVDKRHNKFKLLFDCYNHSHIFDYRLLDLSEHLDKIYDTSISSLSIDSRFFNLEDTENIIKYFEDKINNKKSSLTLTKNNEFYPCNFERGVYK